MLIPNVFSFGIMAIWPSLVAQMVKSLPAMQETWVQFLGQEDTLEKEMATHSSNIAWKILWMEQPGRLQSMGLQRVGLDRVIKHSTVLRKGYRLKNFRYFN